MILSEGSDCRLEVESFATAVGQRVGLSEVGEIRHQGVAFHCYFVAVAERATDAAVRGHAVHFDGESPGVDAINHVVGTSGFDLRFFFGGEVAA